MQRSESYTETDDSNSDGNGDDDDDDDEYADEGSMLIPNVRYVLYFNIVVADYSWFVKTLISIYNMCIDTDLLCLTRYFREYRATMEEENIT